MFDLNDSLCAAAMKTIKRIAEKHDADPSAIIYAWIMYHPAGAVPISASNRLDRLDTAIKALDIRLEHYEWYEIYKASGQQAISKGKGRRDCFGRADTCLNSLLPAVRPHGH